MEEDSNKPWDDAKKSALVAQIVSGKLSVKSACERHDLSPETIQDWVRVFRRTTLQAFDEHLRQTFLIQGADAAALGTAEYTGTLDDIPVSDLIQTFHMGGKGGVITVTRDGQHSQIWCDKGDIIDAESGPLRGHAAIYRILSFERGQVLADFHSEPRERTIDLPGNVLLLEAARRHDESKRLFERLGGDRIIYRHGVSSPSSPSQAERRVLELCDGARSLGEVLEQSDVGDLETLSTLSRLVDRGQLVEDGVSIPPEPTPATIIIGKETPHHGVSFLPLVKTHHPAPRRSIPAVAFVAAGMLLGTAIWAGASILPPGRQPATRGVAALEPSPGRDVVRSFQVDSSVEPAHAELWLDGVKVGAGRLRRQLPRDGTPHALRIVAPGYAPTTLLFVDAPPPGQIELEVLSPPGNVAPGNVAPSDVAPDDGESEGAGARPGTASPGLSEAAPHVASRRGTVFPRVAKRGPVAASAKPPAERAAAEHESAEPGEAAKPDVPRIQIIEDDLPVVEVIE